VISRLLPSMMVEEVFLVMCGEISMHHHAVQPPSTTSVAPVT